MTNREYPPEFLQLIKTITNKRPRIVAEHILEHGSITTEELENVYGYKHAPRAARDLREAGIPLETFRVKNAEGRSIAAYRFGDLTKVQADRLAGRRIFPKAFKAQLIANHGARCAICQGNYEASHLQIDHRIPYEVIGDLSITQRALTDYMLLCGSCNRAKSWSCEHCPNWLEEKNPAICLTCYWASPENYKHIALRNVRRVDIQWDDHETQLYAKLQARAESLGEAIPAFVKRIITQYIENTDDPH
jgi:hypothetical protein